MTDSIARSVLRGTPDEQPTTLVRRRIRRCELERRPHPPELTIVRVPPLDEQRGAGIGFEVAQPTEARRPFRLDRVDRDADDVAGEDEAHRHAVDAPLGCNVDSTPWSARSNRRRRSLVMAPSSCACPVPVWIPMPDGRRLTRGFGSPTAPTLSVWCSATTRIRTRGSPGWLIGSACTLTGRLRVRARRHRAAAATRMACSTTSTPPRAGRRGRGHRLARAQPWCTGPVGCDGPLLGAASTRCRSPRAGRPRSGDRDRCARPTTATPTTSTTWAARARVRHEFWATWATCSLAPPDPEVVGDTWGSGGSNGSRVSAAAIETWLAHQRRDESTGRHGPWVGHHAIECPLLLVGGWEDGYRDAILGCSPARLRADMGRHRAVGARVAELARPAPTSTRFALRCAGGGGGSATTTPRSTRYRRFPAAVQDSSTDRASLLPHGRADGCRAEAGALEAETITFNGPTPRQGTENAVVARHPSKACHAPVWCPGGTARRLRPGSASTRTAVSACIEWEVADDVGALLGRPVAHLELRTDQPPGASDHAAVRLSPRTGPRPRSPRCPQYLHRRHTGGRADAATGYVVPAGHRLRPRSLRLLADGVALAADRND